MMKISEFFEVFAANADGSHFIATVCLFTASQMDHKARAAFKPSCDCSRCLKPLLSCSYLSSVPAWCVSSALKRCAAHLRANCAAAICSSARAPDMPPTNCANEKLNATASTVVEAACEHNTPVRMERNRESRASVPSSGWSKFGSCSYARFSDFHIATGSATAGFTAMRIARMVATAASFCGSFAR